MDDSVPDTANAWFALWRSDQSECDIEVPGHGLLDILRQRFHQLLYDYVQFVGIVETLVLGSQLLVLAFTVDLGFLGFCLFLADFTLDILVVDAHILLQVFLEMGNKFLQVVGHLENKGLGPQRVQLDEVVFRFLVLLLESRHYFLVNHCKGTIQFRLLLVFLVQQAVPLQHELHFRLGLLQYLCQLSSHDVRQTFHLWVLFFDQFN